MKIWIGIVATGFALGMVTMMIGVIWSGLSIVGITARENFQIGMAMGIWGGMVMVPSLMLGVGTFAISTIIFLRDFK